LKRLALIKDVTDFWKIYEPMFKEYSIDVVTLDIFNYEDQQKILNEEWDGFFWRAKHDPKFRDLAKRFFSLFDKNDGVKTFPSWDDYWHYDDKMTQSFLFQKLDIPTPKTFVFYNKEEALDFVENKTEYPLIYKSSSGAGSANVGLLKNKSQSKYYIKKAFGKGIKTFFREDLQRFYVYFQEYLKNNDGDYRIVCFGKERIFGFYRENKPNQKFASGSGIINYGKIPNDVLTLAYSTHEKFGFPIAMSYDIIKDNDENWVVGEMSVIFGDLKSKNIYIKSPHYLVKKNEFIHLENPGDIQQYFIDNLVKEWGWVD